MGDAAQQDAAAKERITKHMNADHIDSVRRYLEAFKGKSFYQVRDARMLDISLEDIKFSCGGQIMTLPFDPPLKSLREARERVVQLDKGALRALGRDDITITKFVPTYTNSFHLVVFTTVIVTCIVFGSRAHFRPGSWFHDTIFWRFPAFARFAIAIQPLLISMMLMIHTYEAYLMMKKLNRHNLTPYDGKWWLWVGTCFIEGFASFQRLNAHLDEKRREKESKKH